jgi:hypothetical protein
MAPRDPNLGSFWLWCSGDATSAFPIRIKRSPAPPRSMTHHDRDRGPSQGTVSLLEDEYGYLSVGGVRRVIAGPAELLPNTTSQVVSDKSPLTGNRPVDRSRSHPGSKASQTNATNPRPNPPPLHVMSVRTKSVASSRRHPVRKQRLVRQKSPMYSVGTDKSWLAMEEEEGIRTVPRVHLRSQKCEEYGMRAESPACTNTSILYPHGLHRWELSCFHFPQRRQAAGNPLLLTGVLVPNHSPDPDISTS